MSIDREKILQSAQKWVDKKRYDRAIEDYQKIVASDPNDARTLLKIGDLQTRMQAYPDAIATYDRVGNYYAKQGFALKAIAVFKQVRELIRKHSPDLSDRYAHIVPRLAEIYTQLGLTSDALQAYDEVATTFQRTGRERDAIDIFRKMVELDGTNPLPHLRLAEACCRIQDLDDAVEAFWTAAELLLKLGRRDDALKVIERILHFKADPKFARMAAELYLARGGREDGMQALAKLQVCFQANPKDLDTLGLLAQAFTLIDQPDKSIEVYKEMARTARETGRQDLFQELLSHLNQVAPNDEQVRAMAMAGPAEPAPARERSVSAVHVDDADLELIDEEDPHVDDTAAEAPFELNRQSHPSFRPQQASAPDVVVVADDIQVAEELIDGDSLEARDHARKAVVDAESFRRLRLYSKALEVLHIALEVDPRSLDAREKLREILIESGDRDNAIGESITLAALYLEAADPSRAELMLYEVLEAEPNHPAALEMLQGMGGESTQAGMEWSAEAGTYEAPEYDPAAYDQQAYEQQEYDRQSHAPQDHGQQDEPYVPQAGYERQSGGHARYEEPGYEHFDESSNAVTYAQADTAYSTESSYDAYDPQAPLPSYDLEEVSASSAMASTEPFTDEDAVQYAEMDPFADASMDEPFGEQPLPSFPLGLEYESSPRAATPPEQELDSAPLAIEADSTEPASIDTMAVEEALEEAEFFVARGLYDDARAIVSDQLARTPGHPLLIERQREIDDILAASGESRTIDRSQLQPGQQLPHDTEEEDRAFDIAASLEALDQLEQAQPVDAPPVPADNVDVDQVFEKFKEGVRAQVAEADSATHYDLGVAYKEMGLLMDAINEFQLAARDQTRECMCHAMIGMIRLERGELDDAARAYVAALESPQKTIEQEMALYYDLGNVYEMKSSPKEAVYYFKKIARRDPGYRDVSERITALAPGEAPLPTQKAANGEDDFDAVFDDLFESK